MLSEVRLRLDPWLECPTALGPLIDPNEHSCGTVRPHGARELAHPEKDFYVVGMKSYGRAPTFLLATGYEQARSVVAMLAGDVAAAERVELVLPETGVCSTTRREPALADAAAARRPKKPTRVAWTMRSRRRKGRAAAAAARVSRAASDRSTLEDVMHPGRSGRSAAVSWSTGASCSLRSVSCWCRCRTRSMRRAGWSPARSLWDCWCPRSRRPRSGGSPIADRGRR